MRRKKISQLFLGTTLAVAFASCITPAAMQKSDEPIVPSSYNTSIDSINSAKTNWKEFFADSNLTALIDTAIRNNPEVGMALQEIEVERNNVRIRKGALLPNVAVGVGMGVDKVGRYTSSGAGDASTDITPGNRVPDWLGDFNLGFQATWEADIWGKLHHAKKAAFTKYLGSIEAKNWVTTNLVAEVANSYYELLALDNQLAIIRKAIRLQQNELEIVKVQKQASVVTELAVKQFEAQLYNTQSMEYDVLQQITETENNINFLLGRYPQKITRDTAAIIDQLPQSVKTGIPVQLLKNRPDIRQAELELFAAKCEVKIAEAEFYPSLGLRSGLGINAFKPSYLLTMPESLIFSLAGDLSAPIFNRNAIKAEYNQANARQVEALLDYRKSVWNGYREVANEMSNIGNLEKLYNTKSKEAQTQMQSVSIASDLFKSARANYLEVLMAQRESLSTQLELVEARKRQFNAVTNIYKALGGGW